MNQNKTEAELTTMATEAQEWFELSLILESPEEQEQAYQEYLTITHEVQRHRQAEQQRKIAEMDPKFRKQIERDARSERAQESRWG